MSIIYLTGSKTNSDTVHISQDDWMSTYCGKSVELFSFDVRGPATCRTCVRAFELSRDYRVARALIALARTLYDDMQARPGAYLHADRNSIALMIEVLKENGL